MESRNDKWWEEIEGKKVTLRELQQTQMPYCPRANSSLLVNCSTQEPWKEKNQQREKKQWWLLPCTEGLLSGWEPVWSGERNPAGHGGTGAASYHHHYPEVPVFPFFPSLSLSLSFLNPFSQETGKFCQKVLRNMWSSPQGDKPPWIQVIGGNKLLSVSIIKHWLII